MDTQSDYLDALANMRTALTEIEAEITPDVDTSEYALHTQKVYPYWVNYFAETSATRPHTGVIEYTETVRAVCFVGKVTEGIDTEIEETAQSIKGKAAFEFGRRPELQCASFTQGVPYLQPADSVPLRVVLQAGGQVPEQLITVVVNLTFTLSLNEQVYEYEE